MHPCRIESPKIGDEIVLVDEHLMFKDNMKLTKYETYTIMKLVTGTGVTFAVLEGCKGYLYDLSCFVRPNDILLRKHKLEKLYDNVKRRSQRVFKVSF